MFKLKPGMRLVVSEEWPTKGGGQLVIGGSFGGIGQLAKTAKILYLAHIVEEGEEKCR